MIGQTIFLPPTPPSKTFFSRPDGRAAASGVRLAAIIDLQQPWMDGWMDVDAGAAGPKSD